MSLLCRAGLLRTAPSGLCRRFLSTGTRTVIEGAAETVKPRSVSGTVSQSWGGGALVAGCLAGIGSLCFYGLGMSSEAGAIDRANFWSPVVKERVQKTYTVRTC